MRTTPRARWAFAVVFAALAAFISLDCTTTDGDGVGSAPDSDGDAAQPRLDAASPSDGAQSEDGSEDASSSDAGAGADADAGVPPCQSLQIPGGSGAVVTGSQAVLPAGSACYETWARLDGSKQSPAYLAACSAGGDCNTLLSIRNDLGEIVFAVHAPGQPLVKATATIGGAITPNDDEWHHIAGCRQVNGASVTLTLFWDGQPVGTASGTTASIGSPVDLRLGSTGFVPNDGLGGYLDEVRVSSSLRYTAAFTPERRLANDATTELLLHFDTVTATSFTDSSKNALSGSLVGAASGANVCAPPCQSLRIPGGSGAVVTGSQAVLPAGSACYETWARVDGSKQSPVYLAACSAGGDCNTLLSIRNDLGEIVFGVQAPGQPLVKATALIGGAITPNDDKWHHIAGCRQVNGAAVNLTLFWDGQPVGTASGTTASIGSPVDLRLGSTGFAPNDGLGGYLDEVRVSSSLRYTAAFTPQRRLANDATTELLLHFDTVSATSFTDSSKNALSGSLVGTASAANVCAP